MTARLPVLLAILSSSLAGAISARADEPIRDVIFATPYQRGRPTTTEFYYDGRALGAGRDGFRAVVDRIARLPVGTSIIWGPNYARCPSCGSVPHCVPKFLYPDLWQEFEAVAERNKLLVSSSYPGPFLHRPDSSRRQKQIEVVAAGARDAAGPFDETISWEVGEPVDEEDKLFPSTIHGCMRWHRMLVAGKPVELFPLEVHLGRLADQSRVAFRITLPARFGAESTMEQWDDLAQEILATWNYTICKRSRYPWLRATLVAPPELAAALHRNAEPPTMTIGWSNFHGPDTPRDEVLCLVDGKFVGRGDAGFAGVLKAVEETPPGTEVTVPQYGVFGRWAFESYSPERLKTENEKLAKVVPFAHRRADLDAAVGRKGRTIRYEKTGLGRDRTTVVDWSVKFSTIDSFMSIGKIVRHDEKPQQPKAILAWTRYEVRPPEDDTDSPGRKPESTAVYAIDGKETGQGVAGFVRAMEHITSLPEQSVVHVRVCLRTKGPFLCPIVYEGQRHFEQTGYEPYVGLLPWLLDIAEKRRLRIEWIPDEAESLGNCSLNR